MRFQTPEQLSSSTLSHQRIPCPQVHPVSNASGRISSRARFNRGAAILLLLAGTMLLGTTTSQAQVAPVTPAYQFASMVLTAAPETGTASVTILAGTLNKIDVVTQGVTGQDFTFVEGGSCSIGKLYSAGTCSVIVDFQAKYPGLRQGAVVLLASDGSVLGMRLLKGMGTGATAVFVPGIITTVAGNSSWIWHGDGGKAIYSPLFLPMGGATDSTGNLYLSDSNNQRIRRVDAKSGLISTVAGNGAAGGFSGDGGPALAAQLNLPADVKLDGAGNFYIADSANHVIRMVNAATGMIYTVAGIGGQPGYAGDGGKATLANLNLPSGLAFDGDHKLYFSDTGNNAVRMVDLSTGIISTVAGTGVAGYSGEGVATSEELNYPLRIALGTDGSLYIADLLNNRIRKVAPDGNISTVVGTGGLGYGGDGGQATLAVLHGPAAVLVDVAGNLYVADAGNQLVRKVNLAGVIETIAGTAGGGNPVDRIPANTSGLDGPYALFLDGPGNLYIADMFHQLIRVVSSDSTVLSYPAMREGSVSAPEPATIENDGNVALTFGEFQALTYSALDPGTTTCLSKQPLLIDQTCVVGVDFAPTTIGAPLLGLLSVTSNAANGPSSINLSGEVLSVQPTTATLTPDANPAALGTAIKFTVVVSNHLPVAATGAVNFFDGSTNIGTATLSGTGAASISVANLSTGVHTITAVYAGDNDNAAVTPAALIETVRQQTTTLLSSTLNPAVALTAVTFTATVTGPNGATTLPGGVVTFSDGATSIGQEPVMTSGAATLTIPTLVGGQHSITASYGGDALDLPSQSVVLLQTMAKATTGISLATSNVSVNAGVSITFTSSVSRTDGIVPTGTVTFLDGGIAIGTGAMGGAGTASMTTIVLTGGAHIISATYSGDVNNLTSTSPNVSEAVQPIATGTTLAISANPGVAGAAIQLTATAVQTGTPGNGGAFSGTVKFMDAGTTIGSASISAAGLANFSVLTMVVGSHTITGSYGGNANYLASTSASMTEPIASATTSTTLTSTASPTIAGAPITLTATVGSNGGIATGMITFMDGALGIVGTGTLNGKGVASFTTAALAVGQHTLTAIYGGDGKDDGSTSPVLNQIVQIATTSTALRSSLNPSPFGSSVTFTASVATNGGAATGTVAFSDGTVVLGSVPLTGEMAAFSTSALALGGHSITAAYAGDANDAASLSATLSEQVQQSGAVNLISSVNPSIAGAGLIFTATISAPQGAAVTGTVTFKDGANTLGTAKANASGVAILNFATLAVGQHSIVASYSGDIMNSAELSSPLLQFIQTAGTSVTLASNANPVLTSAALTLTSKVVGTGGIATGTVTFQDGTAILGASRLNPDGVASLIVNGLAPGLHSLIAMYNGDANDVMSTSPALAQSVLQLTTVSTSSSENPALALDAITFTATVANGGSRAASGTIVFSDGAGAGAKVLGTVTLTAAGTASFTAPSMAVGQHSISAAYGGDAENLASVSSVLSQAVQLRPTSDTLSASSTSLTGGQQVTLVSVVRYAGPVAPTGTVSFLSNGGTLGTSVVDNTGVATFTANLLTSAPVVTAVYSGDGVYAASTSTATSIVVAKPTQFTLQLNPAAVTLQSQQNRTTTLTIASLNGFTDKMNLGCLGLPFAATCTFSQDQVALGGNGVQTIQVVVDTGSPLTAGPQARLKHHDAETLATMCILPGGMLLGLAFWRGRRKMRTSLAALAMLLLLAGVSTGLSGCGGLHINGTPAGTYVFQVNATGVGTGVSQAIDITLTVTQ